MKKIDCLTLGHLCEVMLDGEPVFIIRAQDAAAVLALEAYHDATTRVGGVNRIRVQASIEKFKTWQAVHQHKVRAAN